MRIFSDAWLDEATQFLQREVTRRKAAFGGRSFSVSERFTNAPPHLKVANDVVMWRVHYDGERVAVSREFDAAANLVVAGDYQAALTAAQSVGVLAPGAMQMMLREVRTLYGSDALRISGVLDGEPEREMFALLHDHMGRRTVENPDLAHRAARQGLSGAIRNLEKDGYAVVERAISAEFADEVRSAVLRALLPHHFR